MDNRVMPGHSVDECLQVPDVVAQNFEARVSFVFRQVPLTTGREVIEDTDAFDQIIAQQSVDKVSSDEACSTDDAYLTQVPGSSCRSTQRTDSHFVMFSVSIG